MANPHLLVVASDSDEIATETKNFLNAWPDVVDWVRCYPNMYLVVTAGTDEEMFHKAFRKYMRKNGRIDGDGENGDAAGNFLVVALGHTGVFGNLPVAGWKMLRDSSPDGNEIFLLNEEGQQKALPAP